MSKKSPKKKVVVSTRAKTGAKKVAPTTSRVKAGSGGATAKKEPLLFDRQNFMWMGIGVVLIALGMIMMLGGDMPDPDTWDPDIIYGFRRTVLAPVLILAGLIVEIYAIFKGNKAKA
ncbi:MAG: DUF3098 domain-containing protein [Bacteroidota bacterium]